MDFFKIKVLQKKIDGIKIEQKIEARYLTSIATINLIVFMIDMQAFYPA